MSLSECAAAEPRLPSASTDEVTLDLITTREGFDALEASWNALFARAGRDTQLFQTFNWLWHWANHFLATQGAAGPELAIVTAQAGGQLVMVWPLVVERAGPMKVLSWMGDPVSQYGDVLMEERPDAMAILHRAWHLVTTQSGAAAVKLRRVREDAVVHPFLASIGAAVTAEQTAPFLDFASAPSFAVYETRYSGSARRKRGRLRRKLAERGAVTLVSHAQGAEAEALAAETFRLKRLWLDKRGILAPALTDPRTARFFADVTRDATRPTGCHVIGLSCNDRPAAAMISMRCKGRTAAHVIAYDLDFEKVSVGALLLEDSIRQAADNGTAVFDLLAPGDSYKMEWADGAAPVRDWAVARSALGRVYAMLYLGHARAALKQGFAILPADLRRRMVRLLGGKPVSR